MSDWPGAGSSIRAEISTLLKIRKSDVYRACDRGHLQYVKFEGIVQVEGQDLKRWVLGAT
jgi:hypothetical protein